MGNIHNLQLASLRGRLFRDAEFAEFYCPDNGRGVPSLLASSPTTRLADAEAKARADFDLRWKVALGIEAEEPRVRCRCFAPS